MKFQPSQLPPVRAATNDGPVHSPLSFTSNPSIGHSRVSNDGLNGINHRVALLNHAELLWRYAPPMTLPAIPPSSSPPLEIKHHLPANLARDPRLWNKENVPTFLQWCETEFDLPRFNLELFRMNGRALCLLTKQDLGERCPGVGDLMYNVLRYLMQDDYNAGQHLPQSPATPHFPLASCYQLPSSQEYAYQIYSPNPLNNSATLSPPPSIDSRSDSPKRSDSSSRSSTSSAQSTSAFKNDTSSQNNGQSDSDGDDTVDVVHSPTSVPSNLTANSPPYSPKPRSTASSNQIFFPTSETSSTESNTNGRLLWDFLQQLLNDSSQRYTNYIRWKNHDTGVFKIVDPPGLAKLWGIQKNHLSMNYDKMSRALRYYYRVNILRKVQGERHCYQFLRNPTELKSIKNISQLRQQTANVLPADNQPPNYESSSFTETEPTDLSLNQSLLAPNRCQQQSHFPQNLTLHSQNKTKSEDMRDTSKNTNNIVSTNEPANSNN